ncbi:MAG: CbtA family protein [Burkholderiaceae bacterium]
MTTFKRIVTAAALAGVVAGLTLTVVQKMQVSPIIAKAEVYEEAATAAALSQPALAHASAENAMHESTHESSQIHTHEYEQAHEHAPDAWQPADGLERTMFTTLANISLAVGFGLLMGGGLCLRGDAGGWRSGLLWGLAGYMVFFVAPSLGLPPEMPGTAAAPLTDRQLWWLGTVVVTAGGLLLLIFTRDWKLKLFGALLLTVPHLIGAPQPEVHFIAARAELAQDFIQATTIANAVFWLALGGLLGLFYKKLAQSPV